MLRVGSPTSMRGRGVVSSGAAIVSPISTVGSPTIATMSPASACSTSTRPSLSKSSTLSIEPGTTDAAGLEQRGLLARLTVPETIRPMAIRPTYSEKSSVVQSIENGPSCSTTGPGTFSTIRSKSGRTSPAARCGSCEAKPALPGGEDVREIELLLAGSQLHEGVEDLVEHLVGPGIGPVDLVDHHDRPDVAGERLAEHELGLGHRPFEGVDQHERPVGHLERSLDLAAEIGVARACRSG